MSVGSLLCAAEGQIIPSSAVYEASQMGAIRPPSAFASQEMVISIRTPDTRCLIYACKIPANSL